MIGGFEVQVEALGDSEEEINRAADVIVQVGRRVSDFLRTTQPTTGLPGVSPPMQELVQIDHLGLERPHSFEFGDYRPSVVMVYAEELRPAADHLAAAASDGLNEDWDLDTYIGQARHLAVYNPDANPALAVFLAVLACEIKIKRTLRRDTPPEQQQALLEIVPLRAQTTKPLVSLFSSVALQFLGRSMKQERPVLFKNFVEMVEARNEFTHRAVPASVDVAMKSATTARRALRWADGDRQPNYPQ